MKRRNDFRLLLTLAITFGSVSVAAHAAQQKDNPSPQATQSVPPSRTIAGPYRLAYTLTEIDGTKRVGSQRYVIVLDADSPHSHLKLDSAIPVHYGSSISQTYSREHASVIIDTTLRQRANGLELFTDIMQYAFAKNTGDKPTTDTAPPVRRDFVFTTTTLVIENKPVTIGQLDIPGSMHILQIQVELTKLP